MTTAPDPLSLTGETLRQAVEARVRLSGSESLKAATHLLTFTDLLGRPDVARHIRLRYETDEDGLEVLVADVDLPALRDDDAVYLTGGDQRFLDLAISYLHGRPTDLSAYLNVFGHAHARRAIEAYIISLGMEGWYRLEEGAALAEHRAFEAELLGDPR
ncbi:hypothetical protein [Kitasatospora sp. NPDC085464]|uniref:hypothetical protein n=1 Tax=Kitasatospora sp. NPDC085464 TaxID=3364063 RepID=UPI0037C72DB4